MENLKLSSSQDVSDEISQKFQKRSGSDSTVTALITQKVADKIQVWEFSAPEQVAAVSPPFDPHLTQQITRTISSGRHLKKAFLWKIQCRVGLTVVPNPQVKLSVSTASFLKATSKATTLTMIFYGDNTTAVYVQSMSQLLFDSPMFMHYTKGLLNRAEFDLPQINQDEIGYQTTNVFLSSREYIAAMYAASTIDHEYEMEQLKEYQQAKKVLILIDNDTSGKRPYKSFTGLITAPDQDCRIQVGTSMKITFQDASVDTPRYVSWAATVIEPTNVRKRGFMSLLVERLVGDIPINIKAKPEDPIEPGVKVILSKTPADRKAIYYKVRNSDTKRLENCVKIELELKDSTYIAIRNAYRSMFQAGAHEASQFRSRILELLRGKSSGGLPVKDLYQHVRNGVESEIGELQTLMATLNSSQAECIQNAAQLKGGLQIIQGPPGTGKTFTVQQMIIPFLVAPNFTTVLVAAPTNLGADDLAQYLYISLKELKTKYKHAKGRYILRLHSPDTERDICLTQYKHVPNVQTSTQSTAMHTPLAGSSNVSDQLVAAATSKYQGVSDKRLQNMTFSVGYMVLAITGVLPETEFEDPDLEKHQDFRVLYDDLKSGKKSKLSGEELVSWERHYDDLFKEVVKNATAIVSTTHGVIANSVLYHVKKNVAAIFLEENAFEREDALAPIFAADFPLDPCVVIIGDPEQLGPIIQTAAKPSDNVVKNAFAGQLQTSFMARQMAIGRPFNLLTEQYRMVADVVALPNLLTYHGLLTSAPCTSLERRPTAMTFRELTTDKTGNPCNRMLVNVPSSLRNRTEINERRSKGNHYMVCVVSQLLEEIATRFTFSKTSGPTVAVLTPYLHQRSLYGQVKRNLAKHKSAHVLAQKMSIDVFHEVDRFTIGTFDGNQGRQFDIVIIDLPVSKHLGFLVNEKRLNVAITRARDGLIIVCDKSAIYDAMNRVEEHEVEYLRKLLAQFEGKTWNRPKSDSYPSTDLYEPPEHESRYDFD